MVPPGFAARRACSEATSCIGSAVEFVHADPRILLHQQTACRAGGALDHRGERGALFLGKPSQDPGRDVTSTLGPADAHPHPEKFRAGKVGEKTLQTVVPPVAAARLDPD